MQHKFACCLQNSGRELQYAQSFLAHLENSTGSL